jgi:hypothetical protein
MRKVLPIAGSMALLAMALFGVAHGDGIQFQHGPFFLYPVVNQTATPKAVLSGETGTIFTNAGASAGVTFNLPAVQPGLCYTFHIHSPQAITIVPNGTDGIHIDWSSLAGGASISSNVSGETVTLCGGNSHWHSVSHTGTVFGKPTKSMPDNTATPIFSVSLPTEDSGCTVHTSFTFVATNGTGCGPGCDSQTVGAVSTTATASVNFDNILSVTGTFSFRILNDSCGSITVL